MYFRWNQARHSCVTSELKSRELRDNAVFFQLLQSEAALSSPPVASRQESKIVVESLIKTRRRRARPLRVYVRANVHTNEATFRGPTDIRCM